MKASKGKSKVCSVLRCMCYLSRVLLVCAERMSSHRAHSRVLDLRIKTVRSVATKTQTAPPKDCLVLRQIDLPETSPEPKARNERNA